MKFKTIYLIILAIFFLGIVIYDLFNRTNNNIQEGFDTENPSIDSAISYLEDRYQPDNLTGLLDTAILVNIKRLGSSFGDESLNKQIAEILNSTDKPEGQVDKLNAIFGIPLYDPLNDSLVIYYDFKEYDNSDTTQPVIPNKTTNRYTDRDPSVYNADIILGETGQKELGTVLDSNNAIINGSHLHLLGGKGLGQQTKNGAYLLIKQLPTFYNNSSFLGFSCSVWFNSNNSTGMWGRIFDFGNGPGYDNFLVTNNRWGNNGYLGFFVITNSGWEIRYLENIYVNDNKWIHLVWTISTRGEWKIYLNNEILLERDIYAIPKNAKRTVNFIGKSSFTYNGNDLPWWVDGLYNGKIADFRLYQREISAENVNMLYNRGKITDHGLPERKGINLIRNGSFSYPRMEHYDPMGRDLTPRSWSATRNVLVKNLANNEYSNHLGMDQHSLGYSSQFGIITTDGNYTTVAKTAGYLRQSNIKIIPNSRYEFSFLHCLWVHSTHRTKDNVYLSVKLGCYINTGTDKSIIPRVSNYDTQNLPGWQKYSIIFTTDKDCTDETLTITLNTPASGHTTCAIASVSLRKLNSISVTDAPLANPFML